MRHRREGRQLSRTSAHRKALLRNLVTSLFEHEQITTTVAKAKEARPLAERLITLAKRGDLHARRQAARVVRTEAVNRKLFETIGPWYKDRPGGYTRIVRMGRRLGDAGEIGLLQLVKSAEQMAAEAAAAAPVVVEEPKKRGRLGFGGRKKKDAAPEAEAAPAAEKKKSTARNSRRERKASGEPAKPKPSKPSRGAKKSGGGAHPAAGGRKQMSTRRKSG